MSEDMKDEFIKEKLATGRKTKLALKPELLEAEERGFFKTKLRPIHYFLVSLYAVMGTCLTLSILAAFASESSTLVTTLNLLPEWVNTLIKVLGCLYVSLCGFSFAFLDGRIWPPMPE